MAEPHDYDVIVIGSGFGGSVMACRLTQAGERVCVLERGRSYGMHQFPRRIHELQSNLFWDPADDCLGLYEFLDHPESDVISVTASGLGGGSLVYANVLMPMEADYFQQWPGGISLNDIQPYYERVLDMLDAQALQESETVPKYTQMRQACQAIRDRQNSTPDATEIEWHSPRLAIYQQGDFKGAQSVNRFGKIQSRCTHCGECDAGCNIHAKNTLDLNYLALAGNPDLLPAGACPAQIRCQAQVVSIEPLSDGRGYQVAFQDLSDSNRLEKRDRENPPLEILSAKRVVLAAGSVGSTRLLLQMKAAGKLADISPCLGHGWCGNGDLEGSVLRTRKPIDMTQGPVISSAIKYRMAPYPDGFAHGMVIQDGGYPNFIDWYLAGKLPSPSSLWQALKFIAVFGWRWLLKFPFLNRILHRGRRSLNFGYELGQILDQNRQLRHSLILLGMGRDRSDGQVSLNPDNTVKIKWRQNRSETHYKRLRNAMRDIARELGGVYIENPLSVTGKIIAVHPLGGCIMAERPAEGVVDLSGQVFGYPGLYVVDGSIIPASTGANPSLTIAANAERIAQIYTRKHCHDPLSP